jgi:hypothetical protein
MKKIFIRSPYFIEVDEVGQTSAKIEVFLWNKGDTEPTTPNYTLSKNTASPTQTKIYWNVSNFAKDFIKPVAPVIVSTPIEENSNTWCYMKVIRYSDNIELDDETIVCLNGYTNYLLGYNQGTDAEVILLANENIKQYINTQTSHYVDVYVEQLTEPLGDSMSWISDEVQYLFENTEPSVWKLPLRSGANEFNSPPYGDPSDFIVNSEKLCEPIYTPIVCKFINRLGGWGFITFFKANSSSIDVTSKDYNLLPSSIDYNPLQGQKQRFNFQGKQKIKCNTGWVDENYSELIQDLLLSEVVLLDNKPAIVKSQSADIKTHLKDKNINYEVEFEYNYGLINDVI